MAFRTDWDLVEYPTAQDLRMAPDLVECPTALVDSHRIHSGRLESASFSDAVSASHGAAAARLLFGFTLDPLARCTQVHTHFSASYLPVCTPVHKLGAAVTRRFFRICPEYFYPRGEQRSY